MDTKTKGPRDEGTKGQRDSHPTPHAPRPTPLMPHKFAELLPLMSESEFAALKADLAVNPQTDKIVLFEGKILDGRNRYRALIELKKEPQFKEFKGTEAQALAYVYSKAVHRNLSVSQKGAAAMQMRSLFKKHGISPGNNGNSLNLGSGKTAEKAGELFGVSRALVEMCQQVYDTDLNEFAKIVRGDKTVNAALQACRVVKRRSEVKRAIGVAPLDESACDLRCGDVIEQLALIPAKTATVIFADPPYNIGKTYHIDKTGDNLADDEFLKWCAAWIEECARVLAPDGSFFLMMNGEHAARVELLMRAAGLFRRNTIYWWENNPENQTGNFSDAVRQIHYFTRSKVSFIFNTDVRVPSRRNEIGDKRGLDHGKLPDNVWIEGRIPGNSLERVPFDDAPPQLPVSIPETCIRVASDVGDTVIDPFNGNGITGIAALRNGRKYIGIDRSKKYLDQSRKWIAAQLAKKS